MSFGLWLRQGERQAQSGFPEPGGLEKNLTKDLIYSQMGLNVDKEKNKKGVLEVGIR